METKIEQLKRRLVRNIAKAMKGCMEEADARSFAERFVHEKFSELKIKLESMGCSGTIN